MWSDLTVAHIGRIEQMRHSQRRQFSYVQYFYRIWPTPFNRRSANMRNLVMLFSMVTVFGAPGRKSFKIDPWLHWNSLNQFLTMVTEEEESPYTAFKRSLNSLRISLHKKSKTRKTAILVFYNFSKLSGHAYCNMRSIQNCKSDFDICLLREIGKS